MIEHLIASPNADTQARADEDSQYDDNSYKIYHVLRSVRSRGFRAIVTASS